MIKIVPNNIAKEGRLHTDESRLYFSTSEHFVPHETIRNLGGEYIRGDVHTNATDALLWELQRRRESVSAWPRKAPHVRFGSQADMCGAKRHVRFTPESDRNSGRRGSLCDVVKNPLDNRVLAYCAALRFGARLADVRFTSSGCLNWARQTGLSSLRFLIMHSVIRGTLGISAPQNLNASSVHASCCSWVPLACDFSGSVTPTKATIAAEKYRPRVI